MTKKLFYLGLEPLAARYTKQLCEDWFPTAVRSTGCAVLSIPGTAPDDQIKVGTVLDATGRGMYACSQVVRLLQLIRDGSVENGDAIFLQDFWTPGFEAVPYALHLHGLNRVQIFSMVHAQSVDEYDFTWDMRSWMRPMEVGLSRCHTAVFVGSTIHRDQLRAAGFECPIHVVGLPIRVEAVRHQMPPARDWGARENRVVFTSRLDREKNPGFMVEVARRFLDAHPTWTWMVTTSGAMLRSNDQAALREVLRFAEEEPRFQVRAGLSKEEYYAILTASKIQFNCSLQDYVSWTLLEAAIAGCQLVYPYFRSFPEIFPPEAMYHAFSVRSAVEFLTSRAEYGGPSWSWIADRCDQGRLLEAKIAAGLLDPTQEVNIWHHHP